MVSRGVLSSQRVATELKRRLLVNSYFIAVAAVLHIAVTIMIFIMGYSRDGAGQFSVSVVMCGFGALETVVWVLSGVYECWLAAAQRQHEVPTWTRLNDAFLSAITQGAFLVFFMWPALVIFIIHEQGQSFFTLMDQIAGQHAYLYSVLSLHIASAVIMLAVDTLLVVTTTLKLVVLQAPRRNDDDDDLAREINMSIAMGKTKSHRSLSLQKPTNKLDLIQLNENLSHNSPSNHSPNNTNDAENEQDSAPPTTASAPTSVQNSDAVPPVSLGLVVDSSPSSSSSSSQTSSMTRLDYLLLLVGVAVNLLYLIDLALMSSTTVSSGTVAPCIIFGLLMVVWCGAAVYFTLVHPLRHLTEDWLVNMRLFTAFHFAVTFCCFYITLCIVLLDQIYHTSFFRSLSTMDAGRGPLCWIVLVSFPLVIIVYALIIANYSRIMWQLEEFNTLRLRERNNKDTNRNNFK